MSNPYGIYQEDVPPGGEPGADNTFLCPECNRVLVDIGIPGVTQLLECHGCGWSETSTYSGEDTIGDDTPIEEQHKSESGK